MPIFDVNVANTHSEIANLWDVTVANTHSQIGYVYDETTANTAHLVYQANYPLTPFSSYFQVYSGAGGIDANANTINVEASGVNAYALVSSINKISMAGWNTLRFTWWPHSFASGGQLQVLLRDTVTGANIASSITGTATSGFIAGSINVAGLTGSYYIVVQAWSDSNYALGHVSNMYLE